MAQGWTVEEPQQEDLGGWSIQEPAPQPSEQPSNVYKSYVEPALTAIGDAGRAVKGAIVGKQDPRFKGVQTVEQLLASGGFGPLPMGELSRAKLAGANDKAYADILQKMLRGRVVARETDANGYPVLTLRADNGELVKGYVNRPGLDWEDVDRGISGAVPYVVGAGVGGRLAKLAGMRGLAQVPVQGGIAGAVNSGQQATQQGLGSAQPFDFGQVGLATAAGAGGELLGQAIAPFVRKYFGNRMLVGPDGKLTARGQQIARNEGLDPAQVDAWMAQQISARGANASNPEEVIRQVAADKFGIPSTKGQRSGDVNQLLIEKDIMASTYGPAARDSLKNVYQQQDDQIGYVARNTMSPRLRNAEPSIPERLNPANPQPLPPGDLGAGAAKGFREAIRQADELEAAAWSKVPRMQPKPGATNALPRHLNQALKAQNIRLVPEAQPVSARMAKEVQSFIEGRPPKQDVADWLSQTPIREIDDIRRVLLGYVRSAGTQGGDKRAAGAMYRGFMDWVDEAAANKMLTGDIAGAKALREAMGATREAREILEGTLNAGVTKGPAAKVLRKLQEAETGEGFINSLIGSSRTGAQREDIVAGIRAYKRALDKYAGAAAKPAWDDVRLAKWLQLVTNNKGETESKGMMVRNVMNALRNQKTLMETLYTPQERTAMRQFVNAIKAINPKDPNPSGSATGIRRILPELAKEAAYTQSKRATFSQNNVIAARMWRFLGSYLKMFEKPVGRTVANRSTSQNLTPKGPPVGSGGVPAAGLGAGQPFRTEDDQNALLRFGFRGQR